MSASIFVSHASADRDHVERLVTFLEAHHLSCWVSYRDVPVGENYQEEITRALRAAKALIVVFTQSANASSEVLKELSLASRYKLLVIPLRLEDVEPCDALAYELATHQWVDLFNNWSAGCEKLLAQLANLLADEETAGLKPSAPSPAMVAVIARSGMAPAPLFVPPRHPPGAPAAIVSSFVPSSPTLPELLTPNDTYYDQLAPDRGGGSFGLLKFLVVAVSFGLLLSNSLQQGQLTNLQLIFWAILVFGCIRLFGAILRALLDPPPPNAPERGAPR